MQRRALATATRAQERDEIALFNPEREIIDGEKVAIILREVVDF
jgi:hypothetical protein